MLSTFKSKVRGSMSTTHLKLKKWIYGSHVEHNLYILTPRLGILKKKKKKTLTPRLGRISFDFNV